MPRVYRHQWGPGKFASKYYVEYRSADGKLHREPAYRDKSLSQQHLAEILKREERIAAGKVDEPNGPLFALVERYLSYATGRGIGAKRVASCRVILNTVFAACGFTDLRSLNGARAQDFLDGLIAKGRTNQTYEGYRGALRAYGRWLCEKEKLLLANPFSTIDRRDPELNRKLVRRVPSEAEFKRLLSVAKSGKRHRGLTGEQRYYLYLLAGSSGLRFGALRLLTPAHFDLAAGTVSATERMQKNKKRHVVPLPSDLVRSLLRWLKDKPVSELLWPMDHDTRGVQLIKYDLKEAGIPFRTERGQIDFHSLRHFCGYSLVKAGASVAQVQAILDHSSPVLSSRYYGHLTIDDLRGPVDALPRRK